MGQYRFKKVERLSGRKQIEDLFQTGNSLYNPPYRILWKQVNSVPGTFPVRIAISVPKKIIRKAVNRNLIRRRIREAYRLHKSVLVNFLMKKNISLAVIIIYTSPHILSYRDIEEKIMLTLKNIIEENESNKKDSD